MSEDTEINIDDDMLKEIEQVRKSLKLTKNDIKENQIVLNRKESNCMNKECICLWVSKERPTDAQRDELKNSWGVTEIIEDVGVELARKRYSDKKPQNVLELADIDFKSGEDEKNFVKELCALVKETGAEVLAGDIHGGFNMYDSSAKVSVLRASKTVTVGEGVWTTVEHNFFLKSYPPFWAPVQSKIPVKSLKDERFF